MIHPSRLLLLLAVSAASPAFLPGPAGAQDRDQDEDEDEDEDQDQDRDRENDKDKAAPAGGGPRRWQSAAPKRDGEGKGKSKDKDKDACRDTATADLALDATLRALSFKVGDEVKPLADVRLTGLRTLDEKRLWEILGGKPQPVDAERAALLLRRLAGLGLFSRIVPTVELTAGASPVLVIALSEHPMVSKVVFEGLGELSPQKLLRALLEAPSNEDVERHRVRPREAPLPSPGVDEEQPAQAGEDKARRFAERAKEAAGRWGEILEEEIKNWSRSRRGRNTCPDPLPPREWVARSEGEVIFPGLVWRGLDGALERLAERVWDQGYQMAELSAELGANGTLTVHIDEGRIEKVEIYGVAPRLEERVRMELGVTPGRPFVRGDVDGAAGRLRDRFPFLRPARADRLTRQRAQVVRDTASPAPRYRTVAGPPRSERGWITVSGRTLALHIRAERWTMDQDAVEMVRHTPVTGFAPGVHLRGTLWDPAGRVHVKAYGGGNVNTRRARALPVPGDPEPAERWRFDWRAGGQLSAPDLGLAELGIEGYDQVDTSDRWRMEDIDSYVYSALINRPGQEYFRREGLTAFATVHVFERITFGVEYRRDQYTSLRSQSEVPTLFNRDEAAAFTPAITSGRMGSLLVRLEASTMATPIHQVGPRRRDPERTLSGHSDGRYWWSELRTVNTLEIASGGLGADDQLVFTRLISDSAAFLRTGNRRGLKLRFRAGGALGDKDLPLSKQEALGGFTALRGYGFKELRGGSFSLLGTAEYRANGLSFFVDVASLRNDGDFGSARTGLGASLNFTDNARFDLAWRADDQARFRPEMRLLFRRTY